ncbi:MAG: SoxR reducing system RseC family protein, partial [Spirochaetota bacterium]
FIDGVNGERGEVIRAEGERVTVMLKAGKACEKCRICTRVSETEMTVEALAEHPVSVGERVTLFLSPLVIVKSAFILYVLPLLFLVAGYFLGRELFTRLGVSGGEGREEMFPALFSLIFLFLSFLPIRLYDRSRQKDRRYRVRVRARS